MVDVVIGMNPHKRSATIEFVDGDETVLAGGRYGTRRRRVPGMLAAAQRWSDRRWAVEGCQGHWPAYRQPAAGRR